MDSKVQTVDMQKDFTRYPAGRYLDDGPFSGQRFREQFLLPALKSGRHISISLDTGLGYGSSFLEEAFGGLVRLGYSPEQILAVVKLDTKDESLKDEIEGYMRAARA